MQEQLPNLLSHLISFYTLWSKEKKYVLLENTTKILYLIRIPFSLRDVGCPWKLLNGYLQRSRMTPLFNLIFNKNKVIQSN